MIIDIGYYAMLAAFLLTGYAIFAGLSGIYKNSANLIDSAYRAHLATFIMVLLSYFSLSIGFLTSDFTVKFIANNSSTDLPIFYKLTAVWGGLEGSLLLWQLLLSGFTAALVLFYKKQHKEIMPFVVTVLSLTSLFLLFMLIGWSSPFAKMLPAPGEGRGLNPLLQNPGMVFHPPSLYLGYVGFNIPFAFAMGSLWAGRQSDEWILATRRWTLVSWFFLTLGMILGGHWAYVELGWGGYWAWDPVENASLMPWLTGTAYLHSVIVQEKRNRLKLWNVLLLITTFTLSILGTFITRSGVLNSVHAFSKSNIGPAFLVFIALILVLSFLLLYLRPGYFKDPEGKASIMSKESSFLLNNVLFLGMAFTVLYGTVFPLLAEGLFDKKLSIQAPFFNSIILPLGVLLIFMMGITQVLGWKTTTNKMLQKNLAIPSLTTLALVVGSMVALAWDWQLSFLAGMAFFAGWVVLSELIKSIRAQRLHNPKPTGFWVKVWQDKRKRGGLIIHLGVVVMVLGFCGNFFGYEDAFTLYPNQSKQIRDYQLTYKGSSERQVLNARHLAVDLELKKKGVYKAELRPAKAFYPTRPEPMTEVAIYSTLISDFYVSLASYNDDGSATLNVYINPMVNFVWASLAFYIIGTFYALAYRPTQLKKQEKA